MGMFQQFMLGRFKIFFPIKKWLRICAEVHNIIDGFIDAEFEHQALSTTKETPDTFVGTP
jgi:hypothetical protein